MSRSLNLEISLQPKQIQLLALVEDSPATWIGYGGSRGGAKSYAARAIMLKRRFDNPGTKGAIFRRTYDLVRENHVDKMLEEYPFLRPMYHMGDKELRLPNGSVIAFRYGETPADIKAYIGKEYQDIVVDQAEMLTPGELATLKSCCRRPGVPDTACKFILTFNPGNVGHAELKRVFTDRNFTSKERPSDYAFIPAYGWDNVEWCRTALTEDGLTADDYYNHWDSDKRFEYFITRSQYGRDLNALPAAMRLGWLLGSMDTFAGQYFDCFSVERHVKPCQPEPYHSKWIGIDWGFAHEAACYWNSQVQAKLTAVYREWCGAGRSPRALAQEIIDRTPEAEREHVKAIWLSHDAFSKRDEHDSVAQQMGEVFTKAKLPFPISGGRDRVGRAALIYDMLRHDELVIDPKCVRLIECLPMLTRDEDNPEDTVKFGGDDPYDAFAHSLTGRLKLKPRPKEDAIREHGDTIDDPLSRWFYLTKQLPKAQVPVRIHPNVVMPWQKA